MDSLLAAATQDPSALTTTLTVAKAVVLVLIGVNMLIIVHEWGHFIVARMCGVKCEKFYIWFDIFGWKLFKFKWGDTEFGLGVLPLGGYVKMLGQEDNPGRLREELEKAKAQAAEKQEAKEGEKPASGSDGEEIDIKAAEAALHDPQSYLSKSVPQRMAIISAGVFMNVIFAAIVAVGAYGLGVYKIDSEIGLIAPGGAAWRADLRIGDHVIEIADKPVSHFVKIKEATVFGELDNGVPIVVRRPGVNEPIRVLVQPDQEGRMPTIGISIPFTTTLYDQEPVVFGTPAYNASEEFLAGDVVLSVNERPVNTGADFIRCEAIYRDEPMRVKVRRSGKAGEPERELTIDVPTRPMRRLGLMMQTGDIDAVQANSPAEKAGLKPGDRIVEVDGEPLGDGLTLEKRLRAKYNEATAAPNSEPPSVALTLQGRGEPVEVELRPVDWYEIPLYGTESAPVPSLGITLEVSRRVAAVKEGTPAAEAGIKPGDVVTAFRLISPDERKRKELGIPEDLQQPESRFEFVRSGQAERTWTYFFDKLQGIMPGTVIELELKGGRTVKVTWYEDDQWHYPVRGLEFEPRQTFVQAQSFGEAISYGVDETKNSLMMVFSFIGKVGTQQISPRMMGGPWTIVKVAYQAASSRFSDLLLFLCVISANLAVINFLPIPVLDGGHMVFLAYEGVRGKPPSENVQVGLSYLGLFFLLSLMIWVFGLDLGLISR